MGKKLCTYIDNILRMNIRTHHLVWFENIYVHMRYQCLHIIYTYWHQQYGLIFKPYPPRCCSSSTSAALSSSNCKCCTGQLGHVCLLLSSTALLPCCLWCPPLRVLSGAARFLCCSCCFASSAQRCGALPLLLLCFVCSAVRCGAAAAFRSICLAVRCASSATAAVLPTSIVSAVFLFLIRPTSVWLRSFLAQLAVTSLFEFGYKM